jgi:acetoin utilization protein AcuB
MWMARDVVTIGPDVPIAEAATLMALKRIRRLPVVEKRADGVHLLGIVSSTDILHAFPPDVNPFMVEVPDSWQTPSTTGKIMNRWLQTTTPDTPIEEAAAMMRELKIGALPVMRGKLLVGIITESDIFRAFVGMFAAQGEGVRITFDVSKGEDVFGLIAEAAKRYSVRVASLIWSQQDDRPVCVVRITGKAVDELVDNLWRSGHPVLNVLRFG